MDYTSNVTLKKEGVLDVQVNYVPPPPPTIHFPLHLSVTLPPTPPPSSLPSGVAYGLIWKVTYSESGQTHTRYISQVDGAVHDFLHRMNTCRGSCSCFSLQHLPFLLLPDEVGPLYRIGSNMLAIRELQCKEDVKVSFAFVNVHGIGPFTTPITKCFYGEVWLIFVHQ